MALSPATLAGVPAMNDAVGRSALSAKVREQLALAIAGENGCDYCASTHGAIGRMSGLDEEEVARNLAGDDTDPNARAPLSLASSIVIARGRVTPAEIEEARDAGVTDAEFVDVVAAVSINTMTNYLNHIAETEIDIPDIRTAEAVS